ncbi:MAG TPA: hypothetical protein VIY69_10685 [Candidatus Acidoferrales bacterium]
MAFSKPVSVFDDSSYPRAYLPSLFNRVVYVAFGGLLVGAGVFGVWYSLVAGDELGPKGPTVSISLSLLLAFLGSYLIIYMFTSKIILGRDSVEVRNLFSNQRMLRQEILGYRSSFKTGTIELIPCDSGGKKLKITWLANPDVYFSAWFDSIPDLQTSEPREGRTQ